jgi:hypothetical protein
MQTSTSRTARPKWICRIHLRPPFHMVEVLDSAIFKAKNVMPRFLASQLPHNLEINCPVWPTCTWTFHVLFETAL